MDLAHLGHLDRSEEGRRWLAALPGVVAGLEADWEVTAGPPFRGGMASWVAPATCRDGTLAVLKVNWPHREAREEIAGLELWDGRGAVRVLRSDRERWALLIERCLPGTPLHEGTLPVDDRLEVAAGLARELWDVDVPAGAPFERLAEVAAEWAGSVRERMEHLRPPFDRGLVAAGADLLDTLPGSAAEEVLLHGDFNPGNVLAAERRPWLVIDAKPMLGDPAYDAEPLIAQIAGPDRWDPPAAELFRRTARFADLTGLPADRIAAWGMARRVESALWYASDDELDAGKQDMAAAAEWATAAML